MVSHKVYAMDCLYLRVNEPLLEPPLEPPLEPLLEPEAYTTVRLCDCATLDALAIFRANFRPLVFAPKCPLYKNREMSDKLRNALHK